VSLAPGIDLAAAWYDRPGQSRRVFLYLPSASIGAAKIKVGLPKT
jgi:hypothetical protein